MLLLGRKRLNKPKWEKDRREKADWIEKEMKFVEFVYYGPTSLFSYESERKQFRLAPNLLKKKRKEGEEIKV